AARTTDSVPILPPAPGRFSITNDWPRRSDSHCPIRRATTSDPPAAANPVSRCTGLFGYACVHPVREMVGSAAVPAAAYKNRRRGRFIGLLLPCTRVNGRASARRERG